MEAEKILESFRKYIDETYTITNTSMTMYDPVKFQGKVSFSIFETNEKGTFKRFTVTVDDNDPKWIR